MRYNLRSIRNYLLKRSLSSCDCTVLYDRFRDTEFEGFTPDTRVGWKYVVKRIWERPVIGHGPEIIRPEVDSQRRNWPEGYIKFYPHNLYLFILYTTGVVGFIAYGIWAVTYWRILCRENRRKRPYRGLGKGLPTLGMVVFIIFLIDQLKVEFLRSGLLDYQHYIAALFGMFVGLQRVTIENESRP